MTCASVQAHRLQATSSAGQPLHLSGLLLEKRPTDSLVPEWLVATQQLLRTAHTQAPSFTARPDCGALTQGHMLSLELM